MKMGDSVGKGVHSSRQVGAMVGGTGVSTMRVGAQVVVVGGGVSCADARVGDSVGRRYGLTGGNSVGDGVDLVGDGVGPAVGAVDVAGVSASRVGVPVMVVGGSESVAPVGERVGGRVGSAVMVVGRRLIVNGVLMPTGDLVGLSMGFSVPRGDRAKGDLVGLSVSFSVPRED